MDPDRHIQVAGVAEGSSALRLSSWCFLYLGFVLSPSETRLCVQVNVQVAQYPVGKRKRGSAAGMSHFPGGTSQRKLDGQGERHPCHEGEPGAVAMYAPKFVTFAQLRKALLKGSLRLRDAIAVPV